MTIKIYKMKEIYNMKEVYKMKYINAFLALLKYDFQIEILFCFLKRLLRDFKML